VKFMLTEEQSMLRDSARSWLARRFPMAVVGEMADSEPQEGNPSCWPELVKMGWMEAAAAGMTEAGLLLEESGYALMPAPFFVSVGLAMPLGADPAQPTTLAWAEHGAPSVLDAVSSDVDDSGRLWGYKVLVPDARLATHAVVTTRAGLRRVALSECEITDTPSLDGTRRLAALKLNGARSEEMPDVDLHAARSWMLTAAASEAVGVAGRALDYAVEHAKSRFQFGKLIGTYQAVSHPLVDSYASIELARSLVNWAWAAIDSGDDSAPAAAAAAKEKATSVAVSVCEAAIQVHGGIGFTWESPLHRLYKRSQWLETFEGSASAMRADVANFVLGDVNN
jgi:alkylation response protein AidB-like acyl-CoA dehydrogenase